MLTPVVHVWFSTRNHTSSHMWAHVVVHMWPYVVHVWFYARNHTSFHTLTHVVHVWFSTRNHTSSHMWAHVVVHMWPYVVHVWFYATCGHMWYICHFTHETTRLSKCVHMWSHTPSTLWSNLFIANESVLSHTICKLVDIFITHAFD